MEVIFLKEIHVVGAAIIDNKKVLVAQRSKMMKCPLKWEFVGGKIEEGETPQQALEREVKEELGIRIRVGGYLAMGSSVIEGRKIVLHVYEAELVEGEPIAKEHSMLQWIYINDIMEYDWAEADLPACRELMKKFCL